MLSCPFWNVHYDWKKEHEMLQIFTIVLCRKKKVMLIQNDMVNNSRISIKSFNSMQCFWKNRFYHGHKNTSSSLIYLWLWCGLGIFKRPRLFVWYHVVPKRLIISLISLSCMVGKRGRHGGSCLDWLEKRTQRCNYLDDCRQWLSALIKIRLTAQRGVGISGDSVVGRPIQQTILRSSPFDIWSKSQNKRTSHRWPHTPFPAE